MNNNELMNLRKFHLIAAVICTVNAVPVLGGMVNGSLANFLTVAVLVISVMILIKPQADGLTKIPCVLGIIAALLETVNYFIGRSRQYTLLEFISDYTFPLDLTADFMFTPRQMDALGLVMTMGAIGMISWIFTAVAAVLYFINHKRIMKLVSYD